MSRPRFLPALVAILLTLTLVAACSGGGSDDPSTGASPTAGVAPGTSSADGSNGSSGGGSAPGGGSASGDGSSNVIDTISGALDDGEGDGTLRDVLDDTGLDTLGGALQFALNASRYEIDGNELHIYLSSDSPGADIACVSASMVVEDRAQVVIHDGSGSRNC